ncbi:MAG: hypothetical protein UT48_C0017G0030 [Parcubacteria group bacterium GW2011_GWE2_39_37]|uniref:DUF3048 domain-containing protein n=1 Tax=Candidatus Falkowbacteria bacterium GW2011_GWF2_39_8 TaxID=1618642 RepID=A0A0G0Q7U0_9BACT|nr:MAG: hypothetical protein UT48_C0017G0030 [Parcubacteria group bacterium GW2011_GWE2_39_37]KKR33401.1 MAG: hypothetical protein UT64_C0009G0013 [Candidatus Falkowbacteria bacterium GW2011_GWF2_39_8]
MLNKDIFFDKKKRLFLITSFFLLFCLSVFISWAYLRLEKNETKDSLIKTSEEKKAEIDSCDNQQCASQLNLVRRKIDGILVASGEENPQMIGVMIDNHMDARPQAGLARASLVYEAEAEGAVTRFLAFFSSDDVVEKIGPVRSARPYFIDWATEINALYVHCGGSPDALSKIKNKGILALDEFYNSRFFWRDNSRPRPHNLFTSIENLNDYLARKKVKDHDIQAWKFKDDLPASQPATSTIMINFRLPDFVVEWKYDKEKNNYIRYQKGKIQKTEKDETIVAKNVIIQYVASRVMDEKARLSMDNVGSDKAIACIDGRCEEGKWKKSASDSRNLFYKSNGEQIEFNAGTTWVEVVKNNYNVVY